jgi:simple sugar transport system ATP-binding protein
MAALVELRDIVKTFGSVIALNGVSMEVNAGEVMCLLGDNGAGKSTLIKTLSGVHKPTTGQMLIDGSPISFNSPRDALRFGIATVHQHLAIQPLMSVTRNFFLGREPTKGWGPFRRFDLDFGHHTAREEMAKMGIDIRDPNQVVGTMSGGERQCVAISRAVYFGAKVLILDEPTAALGVKQAGVVLRYIAQARTRGLGVIFITHNVHHAYPVADRFTILKRGRSYGTFAKSDVSREEVLGMMAGTEELDALEAELEEFAIADEAKANEQASKYKSTAEAEHAIAEELRKESERLKRDSTKD